MNKLRGVAYVSGGALTVLSTWAGIAYVEGRFALRFLPYVLLGLFVLAVPTLAARGKLAYRRLQHRYKHFVGHPSVGTVFVSTSPVESPGRLVESIANSDAVAEVFDSVERVDTDAETKLLVSHTAFHDSHVGFSDDDRLVITGTASEENERLAREIERISPVSMVRTNDNPLWKPSPVSGAPRMVLGLGMVLLLVVGTLGVAGAAYPADAYNPVEKTVLVSFDLRADFEPGKAPAEAQLDKAAFLVDVLSEKRVEMRWELNDTDEIRRHRREAARIAADARAVLEGVREREPTAAQRARADRIESRLARVERRVHDTARRRIARATNGTGTEVDLRAVNASGGTNATERKG